MAVVDKTNILCVAIIKYKLYCIVLYLACFRKKYIFMENEHKGTFYNDLKNIYQQPFQENFFQNMCFKNF